MTVRASRSRLARGLEDFLDDNENLIDSEVFAGLVKVYEELDSDADDLEDEHDALEKEVKELTEQVEELEEKVDTLDTKLDEMRGEE